MIAKDIIIDGFENKYDKAYLVSGDGDFAPIVKYLVKRGKTIVSVAPPVGFAYYLKQVASAYLTLDRPLVGHLFIE